MGLTAVKIKLMPTSPEVDLGKVRETVKSLFEKNGVENSQFEEEPIAFGLKAIIITFGWPEEKPLEDFEKSLSEIENVNSAEVIDIRRAIG